MTFYSHDPKNIEKKYKQLIIQQKRCSISKWTWKILYLIWRLKFRSKPILYNERIKTQTQISSQRTSHTPTPTPKERVRLCNRIQSKDHVEWSRTKTNLKAKTWKRVFWISCQVSLNKTCFLKTLEIMAGVQNSWTSKNSRRKGMARRTAMRNSRNQMKEPGI